MICDWKVVQRELDKMEIYFVGEEEVVLSYPGQKKNVVIMGPPMRFDQKTKTYEAPKEFNEFMAAVHQRIGVGVEVEKEFYATKRTKYYRKKTDGTERERIAPVALPSNKDYWITPLFVLGRICENKLRKEFLAVVVVAV